ncbi:hypothetical protein RvY_19061 [Ramazzottius varieornatus]|uniref:Ribosomal protein mS38 C-terminal domain-containing protein n=1 Tax=Ramazzottius varieornatus TaxID=947166 RepID=A0A1D1W886_RAMVA|nr:hypothetical protein RvY_19061 [Ramazzottius varieornatus]
MSCSLQVVGRTIRSALRIPSAFRLCLSNLSTFTPQESTRGGKAFRKNEFAALGFENLADDVTVVQRRTGNQFDLPSLLPTGNDSSWRQFLLHCPAPLPPGQYPFIIPPHFPIIAPLDRRIIDQILPSVSDIEKCDPAPEANRGIQAPTADHLKIEYQAARLIKIRRSKMNKHKYRKLRKRMGHIWTKYRNRRKMRRLKEFDSKLAAIVAKAKAFDPEVYVRNFIVMAKESQKAAEEALNSSGKAINRKRIRMKYGHVNHETGEFFQKPYEPPAKFRK